MLLGVVVVGQICLGMGIGDVFYDCGVLGQYEIVVDYCWY